MPALYGVIAEILIRLIGYFLEKKKVNRETKENFHIFIEAWQKSKNNPVNHYEDGQDLMQQMDDDLD